MSLKAQKILLLIVLLQIFVAPAPTLAQEAGGGLPVNVQQMSSQPNSGQISPQPNSGQIAPSGATGFQLVNPLNVNSICGLIKKVLEWIMALGIPIIMLFLVYAGFLFVMARGSPGGLEKARENLRNVIIGTAIFLGAWLLGQVIANTINSVNPGSVSGINSCN